MVFSQYPLPLQIKEETGLTMMGKANGKKRTSDKAIHISLSLFSMEIMFNTPEP